MSQGHLAFVSPYTRHGLGLIIAIKLLVDVFFAHLSVQSRFEKASVTAIGNLKQQVPGGGEKLKLIATHHQKLW